MGYGEIRMKIRIKIKIGYGLQAGTIPYLLTAICYLLPCLAAAAPFSSWIDVKAECGASFSLS